MGVSHQESRTTDPPGERTQMGSGPRFEPWCFEIIPLDSLIRFNCLCRMTLASIKSMDGEIIEGQVD
ncbi:hypothetical protein VTO42DRAFT_7458 [Malbranchea cinnamomea]